MLNKECSSVQTIIQTLDLQTHVEGGYYRRSYESKERCLSTIGDRALASSIYYLLTEQQPIGQWHKNSSDIMHYFNMGSALSYYLISPEGVLEKHILSNDLSMGRPQLLVPGGYWKATHLASGTYALLSEAVVPGFDFQDMVLGKEVSLESLFPEHSELIEQFSL